MLCIYIYLATYVPRPLPTREKGLVHTDCACARLSVKLSVFYSLPRDILTFSSNKHLGKRLRCRLPVNRSNEVFALVSCVCWLNARRLRR